MHHIVPWTCLVLVAVSGALSGATTVIDSDFSTLSPPPAVAIHPGDRISGTPGLGWGDNSAWAKVWASYQVPMDQGHRLLRVVVSRLDQGRCQWLHDLPLPASRRIYRLTVTARSGDHTVVPLGIRLREAPYTWLWKATPVLGKAWRTCRFEFALGPETRAICLMMGMDGPGSVDISRVSLEQVTIPDIRAERQAAVASEPLNLVSASRFPLGLPSGWALDQDHDDLSAEADPAVPGPSGCASLRCDCPTPATIYAAPFPIYRVDQAHTVSVAVRGDYTGVLAVICDQSLLASTSVTCVPGQPWKRIALTFHPRILGHFHGLSFTGHGHLWIDALQVEVGDAPTPYASQGACEVALACSGPLTEARVLFDDQPALVDYDVTGSPAGVSIAGDVVNAYGDRQPLVTAPIPPGGKGSVAIDAFPQRPYGAIRLDAWVLDAQGRRVSPIAESVIMRIRRPRAWGVDAPWSSIGVHTNPTPDQLVMAKAIGANWVRLHDAGTQYIGWYHLEPAPGVWHFFDAQIQRYRAQHLEILGLLSTAPGWATSLGPKVEDGYFEQYCEPTDLTAWATYVATVVKRYHDVIGTYEIWNEPWGNTFWYQKVDATATDNDHRFIRSPTAAADYAHLMTVAYDAAKAVDPRIRIVGISGTFGVPAWSAGVVAAGGATACDIASYHEYTSGPLGQAVDTLTQGYHDGTAGLFAAVGGKDKPVWLSEGAPVGVPMANGLYLHTLPVEDGDDGLSLGDRLGRFVAGILSQGVRKVFLYSMHCHSYFGQGNDSRLLVCADGYLHPSAAGLSTVAWYIDGLSASGTLDPAPDVHVMLFHGRGRSVAVICPASGNTGYHLPGAGDLERADVFGNPLPAGCLLGRTLVYVSSTAPMAELAQKLSSP